MALYVEVVGMWRLTLTPPIIKAARRVVFLADGPGRCCTVCCRARASQSCFPLKWSGQWNGLRFGSSTRRPLQG
jgi:hypothetical protein